MLDIEISDAERIQKALVVLGLMASGNRKMEACKKAGIPYRTFKDWEDRGLVTPAISILQRATIEQATQAMSICLACVFENLPAIIDRAVHDSLGESPEKGENAEKIYARDRQAARQWLVDLALKMSPHSNTGVGGTEADHLKTYEPLRQKVTVKEEEDGSTTVHIAPPPKIIEST